MTAGLPGTGIGGLFYVIGALLMPFRELWRALWGRGRYDQRQTVVRQGGLAVMIIGAVWATGLLLGLLHIGTRLAQHATTAGLHVLYITPLIVAFTTLSGVLIAVELARVVVLVTDRGSRRIATSTQSGHSEAMPLEIGSPMVWSDVGGADRIGEVP